MTGYGAMVRRWGPTTWATKLIGRRYVLAWGLSVAGVSLHLALTPGVDVAWQMWAMGLLAITSGLLGLWWAEPYVHYRYRRRRFRRALAAEGGWRPWSLHLPARPWIPMSVRRWGARRKRLRTVPRLARSPAPAGDRLGTASTG